MYSDLWGFRRRSYRAISQAVTERRGHLWRCEDDGSLGRRIIIEHQIGANDTVVGISASGSARFVIEALQEAKDRNAATVAVVNASNSPLAAEADVSIEVITGPEVISGSTRMKAGTAQKLVLNMLSTASMIKMGKVYGNLMVDLKATNRNFGRGQDGSSVR